MRVYAIPRGARVHGLSFAPAGGLILVVHGTNWTDSFTTATWLDLDDGTPACALDARGEAFAVSADHARLAVVGDVTRPGESLTWCDLRPPTPDWQSLPLMPADLLRSTGDVAFTPDGSALVAAAGWWGRASGRRHRVAAWGLDPPRELWSFDDAGDPWDAVAVSPDGSRVAVGSGSWGTNYVSVWDDTGRCVTGFAPPDARPRGLAFAPDNSLAVASGRCVYLLPPDSEAPRLVLAGHTGQVNAVALSRDGSRLLTASHDHSVRVWDAATGAAVATFDWKIGQVMALAVSADGLTAAAAGKGGRFVVWDVG